MKPLISIVATVTLSIAALTTGCQSTNMDQNPSQTSLTVPTYSVTNHILQQNYWQLTSASKLNGEKIHSLFIDPAKPLILNFDKVDSQNIVSLMNTCNTMSSDYQIVNGTVKIGNIMSTMMACPEPEASFDRAAVNTVMGKYTLSEDANKTPILVITGNNQVAHFRAIPKNE